MSLCAHGMAGEFEGDIAVNCIWPRTAIWVCYERIEMSLFGQFLSVFSSLRWS